MNEKIDVAKQAMWRAFGLYRRLERKVTIEKEREESIVCPLCRGSNKTCEICKGVRRVVKCEKWDRDSKPCVNCDGNGWRPIWPYSV